MISKWEHVKPQAIQMRRDGYTKVSIQKELGVPLSTLSRWFKKVVFTKREMALIEQNKNKALLEARRLAALTHNASKKTRIELARDKALETISRLPESNNEILELALAMLYLGEGAKADKSLRLGNSNPMIVRFYVDTLERLYNLNRNSFRIALHLRADQDENQIKEFWSKELDISISSFTYCVKDSRTIDRPTYSGYHGVCVVDCGPLAIQRKLMYLAEVYCKRVSEKSAVSSVGRACL